MPAANHIDMGAVPDARFFPIQNITVVSMAAVS